ncbi:hypothetical protein KPL47_09805 [Clostridium estertheticum]|uniref:hypothetical protein n=1 Tax=Clostridium estertheticum TaxID=238834 RepID=UPI001C0DF74A|nr:hypothetical protein [Clostridium estertheticum]MBU3176666.1 hypothetical protein [Clostridium estertheticum]
MYEKEKKEKPMTIYPHLSQRYPYMNTPYYPQQIPNNEVKEEILITSSKEVEEIVRKDLDKVRRVR